MAKKDDDDAEKKRKIANRKLKKYVHKIPRNVKRYIRSWKKKGEK